MTRINLTNAPYINTNFIVTQTFKESHHAIDLAPYGGSQPLYAIDNFTVIGSYPDTAGQTYGNYFIARNNLGMMYLYAHLASSPPAVGDVFTIHQYVGMAGMTDGDTHTSTGIHLHLEMQQGTTWNYQAPFYAYTDPTSYLDGIINVVNNDNVYYYDGTPYVPPTDIEPHKFPWFIFDADSDILGGNYIE